MKILLTADIHIGRRSSRIPEELAGPGYSCAEVWRRIVGLAIAEEVDVLAVAGDLIDRENRYFEAFGPLEAGLGQLADAGIDVLAVAGNHDHDLLGRIAKGPAGRRFHLLGQDGRWERKVIQRPGGDQIEARGWSFPQSHVSENPMHTYDLDPDDDPGIFTIGLLHTDLGNTGSRYAPTTAEELKGPGVDLWLIGHGHKPARIDDGTGPVVINPGSPQAMDPGETGLHGVWIADVEPGIRPELESIPLSTAFYDRIEIEAEGLDDANELKELVIRGLLDHTASVAESSGPLEVCSYRVYIRGRTRLHHRLEADMADLPRELRPGEGLTALVEKIIVDTRPEADLEELARGQSPPALLARLLLNLESGGVDAAQHQLIQDAQDRLAVTYRAAPFNPLITDPLPDAEEARQLLIRQGRLLLDALLAQKERPR